MTDESGLRYPALNKRIIAIVGGFGSGKTEVSVNLAKYFAAIEKIRVTIVDLDLVNPYFRSREVISELEAMGIAAIAPRGSQFYADLPILMPEVKGAIEKSNGKLILDVGGDAQGTRALGSIAESVDPGDYEMLMVLNSRRPQTSDVAGCMKTIERIEASARLKFTGLISNTHMIDETTPEILVEGYHLALEVSRTSGLPVQFVSAKRSILDLTDTSVFVCPVLPMTRSMLKPWERKEKPV